MNDDLERVYNRSDTRRIERRVELGTLAAMVAAAVFALVKERCT